MFKIIKTIIGLSICLTSFLTFNAHAGSTTATTQASALLAKTCTINTGNINFGNLAQHGSSPSLVWATGNVQTLCSKNVSYSIVLSYGNNVDSYNYRRLIGASSSTFIQYTLCQSQSAGGVFGTSGGCSVAWRPGYPLNSTGTGVSQNFTIYALTQTGYYNPDNYSDTIVATLTY